MKGEEFVEGDRVEYHPVGAAMQTSTGRIARIITDPELVGAQVVKASEDVPRYVIVNDHTGKETAYKKENLIKKL